MSYIVPVIIAITLVSVVVSVAVATFPEELPRRKTIIVFVALAGATAWIWAPWLLFGVATIWRINIGAIDKLEQAHAIVPAEPKVIDFKKVEPE